MRSALLGCCLLAALLAPVAPASVPAWTDTIQADYDKVMAEVREQRWQKQEGAQPGDAELRLATLSAALLTRLKEQPTSWETAQRRLQLQQNAAQMNLGKVELDAILSVDGELRQEKVYEALQEYLNMQKAMAESLGMKSASQLWWSPFVTSSGDARSQLQTMWSEVGPLVSSLTSHLRGLSADDDPAQLIYGCAARDDCSELVKLALPYPDVSNVVSDLLHEKKLTTEQVARLAEKFLTLLGLPAAPAEFWTSSQFQAAADCSSYVDSKRMRLCADADLAGLKSALALMTDAEYLRTAAASQKAPFESPAFPGFERAVSECVALLSLQPSVIQQLVYGYQAQAEGEVNLAPVSLYLARGGRPSGQPDARCAGDIGCQQAANAVMEAAVRQLLPLGYHMASLHWLETLETSTETNAAGAWKAELQRALGEPAAAVTPARLDAHFYDAGLHISRLLSGLAGFQLRAAACPGTGECLPKEAKAAGALISRVMAAGSSLPWDQLLSETTQQQPSAAALIAFFQPLHQLTAEPSKTHMVLHTLELDDDAAEKASHLSGSAGHSGSALAPVQAPSATYCSNLDDESTSQERALCDWNEEYGDFKRNLTNAEWELGLESNSTQKGDNLVATRKSFLLRRNTTRSALTGGPETWVNITNDDELKLWGQMFILSEKDVGAAKEDTLQELLESTVEMYRAYVGVSVCPYNTQDCDDNEKMTIWDIQKAMSVGNMTEKELQYYWREYRAAAKDDLKSTFDDYISRGKDAAEQAGLDHYGMFWLQPYGYGPENDTLLDELAATWEGLDELYRSLHTVVRHQLKEAGLSSATGKQPLPSHLLGDMFAADWRNIYDATRPYDNYTIDIADKLKEKNYDIVKVQGDATKYLTGLGLDDISKTSCFGQSHWAECSRGQDCDALAWTSGDDDCVKIRVTTEMTMDNYERVHTKSAELAYYLAYKGLDAEYRAPANPAFTEAVAGAVSLSVLSVGHLKTKGLQPMDADELYNIDFLYRRALQYLAPLPFSYVTDKWLWETFKGDIDRSEHRWWELREDIQGVRPSEKRGNDDADMLAVPDVARDRPAFQRYMSTVLQFQLFEYLCIEAGQFDIKNPEDKPLHRCDLTDRSNNLTDLKTLVEEGSSMRWKYLLSMYTVNGTLSSASMVRYFAPLAEHLQTVIEDNGLEMHWESNLDDYWDENVDNTVPIVVGVVLGVLVLIVVIAYFVSRARRNKDE